MGQIYLNEREVIEIPSKKTADLMEEIATRQNAMDFSGWLGLLPDPDPVLSKMGECAEILKSLEADPQVTSEITKRKSATKKKDWSISTGQPDDAEPTKEEVQLKEWLQEDFEDLNIRNLISQILDTPFYGMVPIELLWKSEKGRLRLKELRPVPFRWFGYDDDNKLRFKGENEILGDLVDPFKFVVARNDPTYENPYGKRLLSRCFWSVTFKRGGIKFWVTFAEKYGMPWVVGRYVDHNKMGEMLSQLSNMVRDAVAVIPKGAEVDIKDNNSKSSSEIYKDLKQEMDKDISKVICGQTLTSDATNRGTQALGTVHQDILGDLQADDESLVEDIFNEIAWIYTQVNGSSDAYCPVFEFEKDADYQEKRAERDSKLASTNQLKFKKKYFVDNYGFQEDEIEEAGPQKTQEQTEQPKKKAEEKEQEESENFSENPSSKLPTQEELDKFIKAIPEGELQGISSEAVSGALKLIAESSDYEEVIEKLANDFPGMDTEKLQETLARAIFVSEVWGRTNA
jgi:phage gp29-like protein